MYNMLTFVKLDDCGRVLGSFNSKIFKGEKTFVRVDVVGDTSKCVTIFEAKETFNKNLDTIWHFLVPSHIWIFS